MNTGIRITVLVATMMILIGLSFLNAQTAEKPDNSAIEKAVLDTYAEITKVAESVDGEKLFSYVLENDKGAQINNGKLTMTRQEAMGKVSGSNRSLPDLCQLIMPGIIRRYAEKEDFRIAENG